MFNFILTQYLNSSSLSHDHQMERCFVDEMYISPSTNIEHIQSMESYANMYK